jgi:hypothetical protein
LLDAAERRLSRADDAAVAKLVHDRPPQLWLWAVGLTHLKPNPRRLRCGR